MVAFDAAALAALTVILLIPRRRRRKNDHPVVRHRAHLPRRHRHADGRLTTFTAAAAVERKP